MIDDIYTRNTYIDTYILSLRMYIYTCIYIHIYMFMT